MANDVITLKMGRKTYTFTDEDIFMDNGCTQCTTQKVFSPSTSHNSPIRLTQKAEKEMFAVCDKVEYTGHNYKAVTMFTIKLKVGEK